MLSAPAGRIMATHGGLPGAVVLCALATRAVPVVQMARGHHEPPGGRVCCGVLLC